MWKCENVEIGWAFMKTAHGFIMIVMIFYDESAKNHNYHNKSAAHPISTFPHSHISTLLILFLNSHYV